MLNSHIIESFTPDDGGSVIMTRSIDEELKH